MTLNSSFTYSSFEVLNLLSVEDLCDRWLPGELLPGDTASCSSAIPRCHRRGLVLLSRYPDLYAHSSHVESQNHARCGRLSRQGVRHRRAAQGIRSGSSWSG